MYVILLLHTESKFACQGQHTINLFILFTSKKLWCKLTLVHELLSLLVSTKTFPENWDKAPSVGTLLALDYGLNYIFFRNKTFLFFKLKLSASVWKRISWNLTKFQLIQLIQTIFISIFSIRCLIELKFCEVSRNSFLNRCWKFQLSILKNKKVF